MAGPRASVAAARELERMEREQITELDCSMLNLSRNPLEVADLYTPMVDSPPQSPSQSSTSSMLSPSLSPCDSSERSTANKGQGTKEKISSRDPSDAAARALALNTKIQVSLREELTHVDQALDENREALHMALTRFCSRSPVVATSSGKFFWARAVDKFLETRAHPATCSSRKEQETLLRMDSPVWPPLQAKALKGIVAKLYPAAANSATAVKALDTVDWVAVASSLDGMRNGSTTPSRSKRVFTAEECRARWMHFEMPGVVSLFETWTKDEDLCIIEQVGKYGDRAWVRVAEEMAKATGRRFGQGRTPIACFKRYQGALSPRLMSLSRWSEAEDAILHQAIETFGCKEWLSVSRALPDRTPAQCYNRWKHVQTSSSTSVKKSKGVSLVSSDVDDDADVNANADSGSRRGTNPDTSNPCSVEHETSDAEGQRSGGDGDGDPSGSTESSDDSRVVFLRGGPWTATEERRLCLAVRGILASEDPDVERGNRRHRDGPQVGGSGSGMGAQSPDHPMQNALEVHQKKYRKCTRYEEIRKVDWREISTLMNGSRSDKQCREKWYECIDPNVSRGAWSEDEDAELLRCVKARIGGEWVGVERDMHKWAKKHRVGRRTDQQCKRRFAQLRPAERERHLQFEKDRRAVEPARRSGRGRLLAFNSRTDVTIEDYDVESESDGDQ